MEKSRKLWQSRSGVAAVEFALIAIPALILIVGSIQNAMLAIARISLDIAVQNFAYDLANAPASDVPAKQERGVLCQKPALYLIDCETDPDFCFLVTPFDPALKDPNFLPQCPAGGSQTKASPCCYSILVQYPVPLAFDVVRLFGLNNGGNAAPLMVRSVALIYRS